MGRRRKRKRERPSMRGVFERCVEEAMLRRVLLASRRDWRAAAWYLERTRPELYAAGERGSMSRGEVQEAMAKLTEVLVDAVPVARFRKEMLKRLEDLTREYAGDEFGS